jgi:hypothetical protein
MIWTNSAYREDEKFTYVLVENSERDHLGDLDVDGRIILEWIFGK